MKKYWLGLTLLVLVLGYLALRPKTEVPTSESVSSGKSNITVKDNAKCADNSKYFVISQEVINHNNGFDFGETIIVVKTKGELAQHFECTYTVEKNDFVIRDDYPQYMLALENNFLIMDNGTGPDIRPFLVYDLNTRKIIYQDNYLEILGVKNNKLEYWTPADTLTTAKNCPTPDGGLSAGVDSRMELNLLTLTKKNLNEYRCTVRQ